VEYTNHEDGTWSFKLTFEDDPVPIESTGNFPTEELAEEQVNYNFRRPPCGSRRAKAVGARIRYRPTLGQCDHRNEESIVTCKSCKVAMRELKGHIYHQQRKWRCPKCKRVRMQAHKPR
jgi:hypothetical protein